MQLPSISSSSSSLLLLLLPYYYASVASGLAISSSSSSSSSPRDSAPDAAVPATLPRITSISYSGDGCPSSSAGAVERTGGSFGNDGTGFRLNGFEASSSAGIQTTSTACQIHLQASGGCTAGWQVGIQSVTVKGRLVLDPGASADWYVTSYWSESAGSTSTIQGTVSNTGSSRFDEIVSRSASASASSIAWSPCSKGGDYLGILNVSFRVALDASGKEYAYFGKDGSNAAAESWNYIWRRC